MLQVYKFCQCKNNSRKVYASDEAESRDQYEFIVDCNQKRVFFPSDKYDSNPNEQSSDDSSKLDEDYPGDVSSGSGQNTKKTEKTNNIWSIFGISTKSLAISHTRVAASTTTRLPAFMCTFLLIFFSF